MKTKNLIIHVTNFIIIILSFSSCTNQIIKKSDLCDNSFSYWDYYPYDTLEYNNLRIIATYSLKFCKNDSVYRYTFSITDSLRRTCDDPQTWKISGDKLIISNNDTIRIDSLFNDTLFTTQSIFDSLRLIKLVRNNKKVKEELCIKIPTIIE